MILAVSLLSFPDCKKQPRCGCNGDSVITLTNEQVYVYFDQLGGPLEFIRMADPSSIFYFCNPSEMAPKMANSKNGDILLVTCTAFWDCNYAYQSSNYYYNTQRYYTAHVTNIYANLYGKDKPAEIKAVH